jgi:hypothetical protein
MDLGHGAINEAINDCAQQEEQGWGILRGAAFSEGVRS